MPVNALIIRGLLNLYPFYGDDFTVECPTGSGNRMTLFEVAQEISKRLASIFLRDENGCRPVYGGTAKFQEDPHWRDLVLFYEYFHGDNGAGLGASHQTGWTGTIASLLDLFGRVKASDTLMTSKERLQARIVREQVGGKAGCSDGHPSLSRALPNQHPRPPGRTSTALGQARQPWMISQIRSWTSLPKMALTWSGSSVYGKPAKPRAGYRCRTPNGSRNTTASCRISTESDVSGSCFAVRDYHVHTDFGGDAALARLRERLRQRGLRLILDFVPNHVAPDHIWVEQHPDFFIEGTEEQLAAQPQNYRRLETANGNRILAYGRDPYFAGWPDTLQLNYGNPALQDALLGELQRISSQCDGVRCDMAMLVLPEIFERTWGIPSTPFWPQAIAAVKAAVPGFLFMAEVYWDLEWTLQQQGFDYTYDKRLYDRLREGHARPVHDHLLAGLDFQDHLARFLENHDEPRAAATFAPGIHQAAAVITFLTPGLRFFHQGQREGKRARIPTHLGRGPVEALDAPIASILRLSPGLPERPGFPRWEMAAARYPPRLGREWEQ